MKKRMLSILLTLFMVLSLLPTTALASNVDSRTYYDVDSWAKLKEAIENIETIGDTYDAIRIQSEGFLWPENDDAYTLTIDFKNNQATDSGGTYQIYLTGSTWTIPSHVTVYCYERIYFQSNVAITLNGTWYCMRSSSFETDSVLSNYDEEVPDSVSMVVNGSLTGSDTMGTSFLGIQAMTINGSLTTNLSPTMSSMNNVVIGSGAEVDIRGPWSVYDLTLADGVTLTGSGRIYLYGNLTADGNATVSNYIQLYASSTFSGNLTLGDVGINSYQAPALTIAKDAEVSVNYLYVSTAVTVNGTLSLNANRYTSSSNGTLTVNSSGTVRMNPNMTYGISSTDTGSITGSGTLELYALLEEVNGEVSVSAAPTIFGVYSNQKDSDGAYAAFPANVADSVNIVRKWDGCSHPGWSDPVIVAPICTEEGYTVKTCAGCGMEMRSDYTPATGHKNRTFSATQYDDRVKVTCDDCGASATIRLYSPSKVLLEEGVPAKPASFTGYSGWYTTSTLPAIVYENNAAPGIATAKATFGDVTIFTTFQLVNCLHKWGDDIQSDETGHWYVCTKCGEKSDPEDTLEVMEEKGKSSYYYVYQELGYEYGANEHISDPFDSASCTDGTTCVICGYTTKGTKHSYSSWTTTTEATCTRDGSRTRTCADCGAVETQTIPATGHTEETIPGKTATCTEEGLTEGKKCSVCGTVTVAQIAIPALGHTSTESDCTKQDVCAVCDAVIRDAGQHTWGGWTVAKEATCTEAGARKHICTICKVEASEDIPALGHSDSSIVTAPTCTAQGYTTHTCSRCGDSYVDTYVDALGHDWGAWVVDKEATETEDGSQHRTCSRCDAVDTQTISKLPKQEVSWTTGQITWTYGQVISAQNTAYNDTEDCGALTYSSSDESVATVDADGKATIVGAGTAIITATAAKVEGKYAETSASYTLIINKAPLTVTANDHTISYGQAPANNGWTASGFKYDDTQSVVTGTAAYTYSYEQYGNVGSYAINVSGLTAKNYNITFARGTLTVSKATDYTITLGNLTQRDNSITSVTASIAPQDAAAQINVEYRVNGAWTTSLPTVAGEYQVRASLTASDNIQIDGAYTTGTLTVQRSIVVDDTDVSVTVDGDKAVITVTEDELADIVGNADGDVSMNLGGVEGVDELVLPGSLLEALSESANADSLTITTEDASISMSGAVLETVASAVADGEDTVAVKLTAVEEKDLTDLQQAALDSITQDAVIVEVSLVITHTDGTETELHQLGGNVEVTVPYAGGVPAGKYIVVCYLSDDGSVTYVRATYNAETQQVTFTTNHFSNYAVFISGDPAVVVDGGSGSGLYAEGETVTIKADSKSGYTFAGWEIVSGGITLANAKAAETTFVMPAANVELKATYTKITSGGGGAVSTYTLIFDTNGGSRIDSVTKASGAVIDLTRYVPIRAGYDFGGWYSDAKLTEKITSVQLTKNMTVYA
ncbi:MAG: MBG domain-containing protein, partial [Pyramidobacter sp.]|nr:MBG domain-containing protein [Pyramidobacter sp.]